MMARFWSRWRWKSPSRSRAMRPGTQGPGQPDQRSRPSQKSAEVSTRGGGDVRRRDNDPPNHQQPRPPDVDATFPSNIHVDPNTVEELNVLAEQLMKHHDRILVAEADAQRLRLEQQFQLQACQYTLRYLNESRLAVEAEISAVKNQAAPTVGNSLSQLNEKHHLYDRDFEYLSQHLHEALVIENSLAKTENYLVQKRDSFGHFAQSFLDKVSPDGILSQKSRELGGVQRRSSISSLSIHASAPALHPLLQAYYDSVGYVNVLHERLMQEQAEYNDARELRGLRLDRDEILTISDQAFEASHTDALEDARSMLEAAIHAEDAAKRACMEAAIDLGSATMQSTRPLTGVQGPAMCATHSNIFPDTDRDYDIDELTSQIVSGGLAVIPVSSAVDKQHQTNHSIQQWLGRSDSGWEYGVDTDASERAFDHDPLQWSVTDSQPSRDNCEHESDAGAQVQHRIYDKNAERIAPRIESASRHMSEGSRRSASIKDFRPARLARSCTYPSSLFSRRDSQQTQSTATTGIKAPLKPP